MRFVLLLVALLLAPAVFAQSPFINEVHYDNVGGDEGEFVEIAVPTGVDIADVTVTLYNGSNGTSYGSFSGTDFAAGDAVTGYTLYTVFPSSIQNGAPDGVAIDVSGTVVQFLSYEGVFTATDGPANGVESTDIGVVEASDTEIGASLQLTGTGDEYADFTWSGPMTDTPGSANTGQTFVGGTTPEPEISVDPTSVDFGTVDVGSSSQETVFVSNGGDAPLTISSITITDGDAFGGAAFSIVSGGEAGMIPPDGTRQVVVAFSPASANAFDGTLSINSDDADEPTVEVPLSGTGEEVVEPEPEISVDPTSVDFGTVDVGSTAQETVTITNSGDAPLTISSITVGALPSVDGIAGSVYSIVSGGEAGSIPANGTRDVVIAFSPPFAGSFPWFLAIESDDADESRIEVPLSGMGQEVVEPGDCDYVFNAISLNGTFVSSAGGQLKYLIEIDNSANASSATVDIWARVEADGEVIFVRAPRTPTVPAGAIYRAGYNQRIPGFTPDGVYTYTILAGDFGEDGEVCGSEAFTVTKGDVNKANTPSVVASDWSDAEVVNAEIVMAQSLETTDVPVRVGPNPVRSAATFTFGLAEAGEVSLAVYDTRGREVATVVSGTLEAGSHTASFDRALPAGVYVWRLTAGDRVETGRLTVVR